MRRVISVVASIGLLSIALLAAQPVGGAQVLKDISGHWAAEHITALARRGVVGGYSDHTFRPDSTITRAEFSKMAVSAFEIPAGSKQPFSDVRGHWAAGEIAALHSARLINGYDDNSFRPNRNISRAEVTATVIRTLQLGDIVEAQTLDSTSFSDVPASHWAAKAITAAERLDILPPYYRGRFQPGEPATRAEVAALINNALRLQVVSGQIDFADPERYVVSVKTTQGELRDFSVAPSVTLSRNSIPSDTDALKTGDEIYVVADRFGTPVYIEAKGTATREEVATKVSDITKGLLTPEQLKSAIRGDWAAVADGFQVTLYNQLLEVGTTPQEADAIMQKDWASLNTLGRDRLTQALGRAIGISADLATALLNQNWGQAKKLAEVEVTEILLSKLLFGMNPS